MLSDSSRMRHPSINLCRRLPRAFTLVELVIVVLILGILAAVAAPRLVVTGENATKQAFIQHLFVYYEAVERYYHDNQTFPPNSITGTLAPRLEPYLSARDFVVETPIGGSWDYAGNEQSVIAAVGVHYRAGDSFPGLSYMKAIDTLIDDGDLDTGTFQRRESSARFYLILKE